MTIKNPLFPSLNADYLIEGLKKSLPHQPFVLEVLAKVDSTNRYLHSLYLKGLDNAANFTSTFTRSVCETSSNPVAICFAQEQTAGRGRGGQSWFSPPGGNLYFSLGWSFYQPMMTLSGLSLMVGVVIAEVLSRTSGITSIGLKWPNDIYYQQQKLAGILIESAKVDPSSQRAVIGVGINLMSSNMSHAPIDQPFTTMESILGFAPCRNQLALDLLVALLTQLPQFAEHGFALFQSRFAHYDKLKNQHVTLKVSGETLMGVAQGVDEAGRLILVTPTQVYHLSSAEISQCRALKLA